MERTDEAPTLRDVLEWRDTVQLHVISCGPVPVPQDVTDAISRLSDLARRALAKPTEDDLRWAIRNDPIAWAAYNHGRRTAHAGAVAVSE